MTIKFSRFDFHGEPAELTRVFVQQGEGEMLTSIRGKTFGALHSANGTFQWTSAVRGLASVIIRASLSHLEPSFPYFLEGSGGSLASSLDYAICKSPNWIVEMFGSSSNGDATARRLFKTSNSNRKRPGPVLVSLNSRLCAYQDISIHWNGKACDSFESLRELLAHVDNGVPLMTEQQVAA